MQKIASAAIVALALSPATADAARCFGRDTGALKAGNATAVRGPDVGVRKTNAPDFTRPGAGDDIFGGDRVRTGDASMLQLKLCDWSTYTFSPGSESNINEFYSADGAQRRRVINYVRGGLRILSGKDAEPNTEVTFEESGVTMGVRGTGVVVIELDGVVYALLEGPGFDNSGLADPGLVDFTDDRKQEIVAKLSRPGFAVTVGTDGVSAPFMPSAELLKRLYAAFTPATEPTSPVGGAGGASAAEESGQGAQDGADALQFAAAQGEAQNEATDNFPTDLNKLDIEIPEGVYTLVELDLVDGILGGNTFQYTGQGDFVFTAATGEQAVGDSALGLEINFANRTLGGGNSFISISYVDPISSVFTGQQAGIGLFGFDQGVGGLAFFPLDESNFSGSAFTGFLALLSTELTASEAAALGIPPGQFTPGLTVPGLADLAFSFADGAGGEGIGVVTASLGTTP
jgi:hypothetical protein